MLEHHSSLRTSSVNRLAIAFILLSTFSLAQQAQTPASEAPANAGSEIPVPETTFFPEPKVN
jgi:hypothetical protein